MLLQQQLTTFQQLVGQQLALMGVASSSGSTVSADRSAAKSVGSPDVDRVTGPGGPSGNGHQSHLARASDNGKVEGKDAAATDALPTWKIQEVRARGLTPRQEEHLAQLIAQYNAKTRSSKQVMQRYRRRLADNRASAGFRYSTKEMLYPIIAERSHGSRIWDLDGNEYIDISMGFGVNLFGHNPDFIVGALRDQLEKGMQLGPQAARAGELAELLCELTGMERAYICNTGTEAVFTALRLARLATGRPKVALFSGSYHGHSDIVLGEARGGNADPVGQPMIPGITDGTTADLLVLTYGDPDSLQVLRTHGQELAGILVEPVQSRRPEFQPREFLHQLRALATEVGAALIFDEMVTGFRIAPGGAQQYFEVRADLATYGKVAGGGMPLGVVAGSARFLDGIDGGFWQYGDASYPRSKTTFVAGTFNRIRFRSQPRTRCCRKSAGEVRDCSARLNEKTDRLIERLNALFTDANAPIRAVHFGSLFRFKFTRNMDLFFYHLLLRGIYVWEGRNCMLCDAHSDEDINAIATAVQESIQALQAGGYIAETDCGPCHDLPVVPAPLSCHRTWRRTSRRRQCRQEPLPCLRRLPRSNTDSGSVPRRAEAVTSSNGNRNGWKPSGSLEFSLSFFGIYDAGFDADKYRLLLESARFADQHGFAAVWFPERHFHEFGGLSPNPALLAAALARETRQISLRAGSVVLPIHHPIRAAEDWSVVDNLSDGRIGVAFASGWNPDDFVLAPQNFGRHRELMFTGIEQIQRLWSGKSLTTSGGNGQKVEVRLHPMPRQPTLPMWLTIVNNPETFAKAGELGAGVLTNLMAQDVDLLAQNLRRYRQSLADHGHDPSSGKVTVLVHTLVGEDRDRTRAAAEGSV